MLPAITAVRKGTATSQANIRLLAHKDVVSTLVHEDGDREPPVESGADATIDVGAIWRVAMDRYEEITTVKIESLTGVRNVDEILKDIREREREFKDYRHDGSKLDKFRTLVSMSLNPIDKRWRLRR